MRRPGFLALIVLSWAPLISCGGEDPIAPGPDTGPVTAYFDGTPFIAETATVMRDNFEIVVTATASDQRSIEFRYPDQGDANYLIGPGNSVSASVTNGSSSWMAEGADGSGAITVTQTLPTHIEGEFRFTLVGGPDPTTLQVTNGLFAIDFF